MGAVGVATEKLLNNKKITTNKANIMRIFSVFIIIFD
jgi:hypothetical protein